MLCFRTNSVEQEDASEAESRELSSDPASPLAADEQKSSSVPEFPLSLLGSQQKCEVYPDLHKIIQVPMIILIINTSL